MRLGFANNLESLKFQVCVAVVVADAPEVHCDYTYARVHVSMYKITRITLGGIVCAFLERQCFAFDGERSCGDERL